MCVCKLSFAEVTRIATYCKFTFLSGTHSQLNPKNGFEGCRDGQHYLSRCYGVAPHSSGGLQHSQSPPSDVPGSPGWLPGAAPSSWRCSCARGHHKASPFFLSAWAPGRKHQNHQVLINKQTNPKGFAGMRAAQSLPWLVPGTGPRSGDPHGMGLQGAGTRGWGWSWRCAALESALQGQPQSEREIIRQCDCLKLVQCHRSVFGAVWNFQVG